MHLAAAFVVLAAVSAQDAEPPPFPEEGETTETAPDAEAPPPPAPGDEAPAAPATPTTPEADGDGDNDKAEQKDDAGDSADPNANLGVMERWWPFAFDDALAQPVDDALWSFFLSGLLTGVLGHVWLPYLVVGENPDGYLVEAILLWVVHIAPHALIVMAQVALGLTSFIPIVNILTGGLNLILGAANCLLCVGNCFYFMPVAYANAYSRHIKAAAGSRASARRVPPRGVRIGRRSIAPEPAMAY